MTRLNIIKVNYCNLALNIRVPRSSNEFIALRSAAAFGVILQGSFFGFAIWATRYSTSFYPDGKFPSDHAWLFLTRVGTYDDKLFNILYPDLEGSERPWNPLVDDLAQVLLGEGLATSEEAIMTIGPFFYRKSAFLESGMPLELRLISKANLLRR